MGVRNKSTGIVAAACLAILVIVAGAVVSAVPAGAAETTKVLPTLCYSIVGSGDRAYLPEATSTIKTTMPAEVDAGSTFTVKIDVETKPADLPLDVLVENVTIDFTVSGGGKPATFQGHIASALATPGDVFQFGPFTQTLTAPAKPGTLHHRDADDDHHDLAGVGVRRSAGHDHDHAEHLDPGD